ncbi:MAG: hypothetical protein DRI81_20445, partial [Chloroflexi bacterium]
AGAGPIWRNFMEAAHADWPVRDFVRPPGVVEREICASSGALPSEYCPQRKIELFAEDQPPLDEEHDWYQMVEIDSLTGLLANDSCRDQIVEEMRIVITDERGREWAQAHPDYFNGVPLAPLEYCTESAARPQLFITQPAPGSAVYGVVQVVGTIQLPNFDRYEAQYGVGDDPQGWGWISGPHLAQVSDGLLAEWDTAHLAPGLYTLRVTAFNREQHSYEARVQVYVAGPPDTPTALPSSTPLPTETPAPTLTPAPTAPPTLAPTDTPVPTVEPTDTATDTPEPSSTPTEEPTPTPTPEPTETPTEEATSTLKPSPTPEETPTGEPSPTP